MAPKSTGVWEDREVLFDLPFNFLRLRAGERIFERIEPIEDTKGNSALYGHQALEANALCTIHHTCALEISVGLNCILSTNSKVVNSGLRGSTQALYVLAAFNNNRYEFIFTNLAPKCVRHYTCVVGVHKAYVNSRLFRDLKMRGSFIHNKQLKLLPQEQIIMNEHSIWNLSSDSGNLGCLVVTNVRVVWFADHNPVFNVSMPYITIDNLSIRDSKFGPALVIVIRPSSGGYILGFRTEPGDRMRQILSELSGLHQAYNEKPNFGVEFTWDERPTKHQPADDFDQLEEIGEPRGEIGPHLYVATQRPPCTEQPVYSPYLGLAIQPLADGFTLNNLFQVQSTS